MSCQCLYVAATSQHVGKTTSTLGLIAALKRKGLKVGYCKPLGQQFIDVGPSRVDKDALLFADFMGFELVPHLHSPVILGAGATTAYLDNPGQYPYNNRVLKAHKMLMQQYELLVHEGTGHPGVGSVVNLSNAKVAKLINAGAIMVVEAGIGNTLDLLELNLAVFKREKVPLLGVIVNKCLPQKMEKVRHYVGRELERKGIPLLGIMPFEEELGLPLMETITREINGEVLFHGDKLDKKVEDIIAGSLIDRNELKNFNNLLLVVSINRLGDALNKLSQVVRKEKTDDFPLSGIIVTGSGNFKSDHIDIINHHEIPVVHSKMDTYESVIKISRIEVKINTKTPWKIAKAIELFHAHVNIDSALEQLDLPA